MRRFTLVLVSVLFFLAACTSQSVEDTVMADQTIDLFTRMSGSVDYTETFFEGEQAEAIADLVANECPDLEGDFARATVSGRGADIVVYVADGGIECMIFRPHDLNVTRQPDGPEGVVASVNGVDITLEQVQRSLAALPEGQRDVDAVLNTLINDEILRQEAADVAVTEEEVVAERQQIEAALSEEQLAAVDVNEMAGQQARLRKLLDDRLMLDDVNISEENARDFYLRNTNQFVRSEQAAMRHILIGAEGRSEEQVLARAQEVADLINSTDFCELVVQYSDDKTEECGTYVVPRGVLHPNLENAAFNTPANQTAVVSTDAGVHFVQTIQVAQAQVVPYTDVQDQLRSSLVNTVMQDRLNLYVQMLRSDADIVVYGAE